MNPMIATCLVVVIAMVIAVAMVVRRRSRANGRSK